MTMKTKLEGKMKLSEFLFFVSYGIYLIVNLLRGFILSKIYKQSNF